MASVHVLESPGEASYTGWYGSCHMCGVEDYVYTVGGSKVCRDCAADEQWGDNGLLYVKVNSDGRVVKEVRLS